MSDIGPRISEQTPTVIRADHVGSLLRPKSLLDARLAFAQGRISASQLREIEDEAILGVLSLQRDAGIDVVSDGEFRRSSWLGGVFENLKGLAQVEGSTNLANKPDWRGVGEKIAKEDSTVPPIRVVGRLAVEGRFTGVEAAFLKQHAKKPFKITMPGPHMLMHLYQPGAIYPTREAMLADVVAICQGEVDKLVADEVPYIQLDSLRYTDILDEGRSKKWAAVGVSKVLEETLAADNAVLAHAKAKGVTRGVHMCRGNHRSAWAGEGGYEPIAERLFNELDTDRLLLEFDDERSGGLEPLRFVPKGKIVVLGLITTKVGILESHDDLLRRIDEASKYVPIERLAISPQCGFASTEHGNLITEEDEVRKLELVAQIAREVWG